MRIFLKNWSLHSIRPVRGGWSILHGVFCCGWLLFGTAQVSAQNMVCDALDPVPAADCTNTCIVCDLDGIRQKIVGAGSIWALQCSQGTGHVFAFIAMSEALTIEVEVLACDGASDGDNFIEVIAYGDVDNSCFDGEFGLTGEAIFSCNNPVNSLDAIHRVELGEKKIFSSIIDLQIGQVYYIGLTTILAIICEYNITVLAGDTQVPDVGTPELLFSPSPCRGELVTHTIVDSVPLTTYYFILNGDTLSSGPASVETVYLVSGDYELCVSGTNTCSASSPTCYRFKVTAPESTTVPIDLCPGSCVVIGFDSTVCFTGTYPLLLFDANGCDSLVTYDVQERWADTTLLAATLCQGDSLLYQGNGYREAGLYELLLNNRFGCDSLIRLTINVVSCPVAGEISGTSPPCFGEPTGGFSFRMISGVPPFQFTVLRLDGSALATGTDLQLNESLFLTALSADVYLVSIIDRVGSVGYLNYTLTNPPPLVLSVERFPITCRDAADGGFSLATTGGTGSYTYGWERPGITGPERTQLAPGDYSTTVTDQNGCQITQDFLLVAPAAFRLAYTVEDEACFRAGSGAFRALPGQGEELQYLSSFLTGRPVSATLYERLAAGTYTLEAQNERGCLFLDTFSINAPAPPVYQLWATDPLVELGQSSQLSIFGANLETVSWENADTLIDTPGPWAITVRPLRTTRYIVDVQANSGCTVRDSITIVVDRQRKVYVPTAFSPNGDGVNDRLAVYLGRGAVEVLAFTVFNRWGQEVYRKDAAAASTYNSTTWDGKIRGQPGPSGVYIWTAKISFLDNDVELFKGITNLIY